MFVLRPCVSYQMTEGRPARKTICRTQAFLIRSSVIIDDCLPKIEPISERLSRDSCDARVDRFHSCPYVLPPAHLAEFTSEFLRELRINLCGFRRAAVLDILIFSFVQQADAFQACPRAHSKHSTPHIAHGSEAIEARVNPTIHGDVW